jgi:hypothetical protein
VSIERALPVCGALLALASAACGNSATASSGMGEPLRVSNGQFFEGDFPSSSNGPAIEKPDSFRTTVVPAGITGKKIGGLTPNDSLSVAIALAGLGHGYWVVPVGAPDALVPELRWDATFDFARDVPAGDQKLILAAANRSGNFGAPVLQPLTVLPLRPAGHVVASLTWGNDSDLDLHIVGPSGKEVDPKHPNTGGLIDAGDDLGKPSPGSGTLDRDSNAGCVIDGYRNENVVWSDDPDAGAPEPGLYVVRVDMFSACGRAATDFVFDLYIDGQPVPEQHKAGRLLDINADGGGPGAGLFVTEFSL